MSVLAIAKSLPHSPRKVSVVASLIRGRTANDALVILDHTPRSSARAVRKVVVSAIANADHNHNLKPESLQITEITVTPGLRLKRYRAVSHGQAHPFQRKTSYLRIVVDGEIRVVKQPAKVAKKDTK